MLVFTRVDPGFVFEEGVCRVLSDHVGLCDQDIDDAKCSQSWLSLGDECDFSLINNHGIFSQAIAPNCLEGSMRKLNHRWRYLTRALGLEFFEPHTPLWVWYSLLKSL